MHWEGRRHEGRCRLRFGKKRGLFNNFYLTIQEILFKPLIQLLALFILCVWCAHMHVQVWAPMRVHTEARGRQLYGSLLYSWDTGSLVEFRARLVVASLNNLPVPAVNNAGVTGLHIIPGFLCVSQEFKSSSSYLSSKRSYPLSHLPSPLCFFYYYYHWHYILSIYFVERGMCTACGGRSEDNLLESNISFHYVGLRDQTQVFRLGSKCFYLPFGILL